MNIAPLLTDDLKQLILTDLECARFLLRIDIGLSELLRVGVPEDRRFQLDQLSAKIYDAGDDATIRSIETILDDADIRDAVIRKKEEKEKVIRNQKIGALVEDLLRKELEAAGIKVERTGIGSDFELETDFISDGQEQGLRVGRYLLELKSTSMPYVRMTLRQGEEACKEQNREGYVLCVVVRADDPMTEQSIRSHSRFVIGIGALLDEKVQAASELKEFEGDLAPGASGLVEIDMVESNIKLRIAQPVWATGITFDEFVDQLKGG